METILLIASIVAILSKCFFIGVFGGIVMGALYEQFKPQIKKCFKNIMQKIHGLVDSTHKR
jgi:hypothetical protein